MPMERPGRHLPGPRPLSGSVNTASMWISRFSSLDSLDAADDVICTTLIPTLTGSDCRLFLPHWSSNLFSTDKVQRVNSLAVRYEHEGDRKKEMVGIILILFWNSRG